MRRFLVFAISALYGCGTVARAQDTFSFVLFDAGSGAFVSAGGSCIDGDAIEGGAACVSAVVPGVGVVHTQSYFHPDNQALGTRLLRAGLSAKPLLDSLTTADVSLTPSFRQYAIVTADGRTAAYTGDECAAWAGHRRGKGYVLAGNILLDSTILETMERALRDARAGGANLYEQARATLAAAAAPGADRRCLSEGVSSRSCFLRLALASDGVSALVIDERVLFPDAGEDPIVTLLRRLDRRVDEGAVATALREDAPPLGGE